MEWRGVNHFMMRNFISLNIRWRYVLFSFYIVSGFAHSSINFATIKAVFSIVSITEDCLYPIFKAFVERTRATTIREIWVVVTESVAILSRIVFESALWRVNAVEVIGPVDGIVGLFEGTLAVPSVAGVMLGPEGVVDGECELLFPKLPMGGLRIGRCRWHPPEVRHDILVAEERLPVGRVVGTDDGGVVLGTEPCPTVVGGDGGDIVEPLAERL